MTVHLKVPLTLTRKGTLETVDQDSADDITQTVRSILLTTPGTRLVDPGYGVEPRFRRERDVESLADEIVALDPRATPAVVDAVVGSTGAATVTVTTGGVT